MDRHDVRGDLRRAHPLLTGAHGQSRELLIGGVNKSAGHGVEPVCQVVLTEPPAIPILAMDPQGYERQIARPNRVRAERDAAAVEACLRRLADAARDGKTNLIYPILCAVNAYATLGEITGMFREAFGEYQEPVLCWQWTMIYGPRSIVNGLLW